ncbi:membrane protein of unknown function [Candidatus Promineifilum breve]|uniref:DUF5668 domain-containing protein n=1 Tax=Candidatus Promineifilum breve TaxID=1806508 RepID=A0A160T0M2_9CHLR|nr:hypothetical protein [Candidatus Promineifilum breve]CUS01975.2 membrane protein of unknown function [Candidatus Promineifilum breve]
MDDDIKKLKEDEPTVADFAAEETTPDTADGPNMAWVPGLVLIAIGTFFLFNQLTGFQLNNWWAFFILIPAFGSLGNFMRAYKKDGRLSNEARGSLIGSLILFFITAVFIFGWSWGTIWPVFLIIGGIGALLSGLFN